MAEDLMRVGPVAGTGSDATLYTVPTATKVDIHSIRIVNNDPTNPRTCKMSIGADGGGTRLIGTGFVIPALSIFTDSEHTTLLAGDVLHWTGESQLTLTISGVAVS